MPKHQRTEAIASANVKEAARVDGARLVFLDADCEKVSLTLSYSPGDSLAVPVLFAGLQRFSVVLPNRVLFIFLPFPSRYCLYCCGACCCSKNASCLGHTCRVFASLRDDGFVCILRMPCKQTPLGVLYQQRRGGTSGVVT